VGECLCERVAVAVAVAVGVSVGVEWWVGEHEGKETYQEEA
jgi:hypothetical protein